MAMAKATMRAKIVAAYTARTGKSVVADDDVNMMIDMCQGIIEELLANAEIEVTVSGGSSAGTHVGVIKL